MNRFRTIGAGGFGVLLSSLAGPALACGADGCPDLMVQSLTQTFIQQRADRGLATAPNDRLDARLNNRAWDVNANGASPFTATPGESVADFGISLSQLGSWMAKNDADKIKAAKELLEKGQKLPVPAQLNRRVDMWTQTRIATDNPAVDMSGRSYTSYVGADYKPLDGVLLGGMVQLDSAGAASAPMGGSADGQAFMAGPYVAMQLAPNVILDAKAAWGQAHDSVAAGSAATSFQTSRSLTSARIKGDWQVREWQFTPTATIESINESATLGIGDTATEFGFNRMIVGPRFSRQFDVGNDKSIEPFVHINSNVNLDTANSFLSNQGLSGLESYNSIGGGFALKQTDEFTLRATTDIDNFDATTDRNVRTGVTLTIPLD